MKLSGTTYTAYNCFHIDRENTEILVNSNISTMTVGHCSVNVDNQIPVCRVFMGYYLYFCHQMDKNG